MLLQGLGELLQHRDAGGPGPGQPVAQDAAGRRACPAGSRSAAGPPSGSRPWPAAAFSRRASCRRCRSLRSVVEVLRVLQQQPARPLEDLAFAVAGGLVVQLAPQGAELVVEQLDDMEVIEDVNRRRAGCRARPGCRPCDMSVATASILARARRNAARTAPGPRRPCRRRRRPRPRCPGPGPRSGSGVPCRRRSRRWRSA